MSHEGMFDEIKHIIVEVLQLDESSADVIALDEKSGLLEERPEFDSTSVVLLLTALEAFYDIVVEDDEIEAEIFLTFGSVRDFVRSKLA